MQNTKQKEVKLAPKVLVESTTDIDARRRKTVMLSKSPIQEANGPPEGKQDQKELVYGQIKKIEKKSLRPPINPQYKQPKKSSLARKLTGFESEQDNHSAISVDAFENPRSINGDLELPTLIEK